MRGVIMKWLAACLAFFVLAAVTHAATLSPGDTLRAGVDAAFALYQQKKYNEADAEMEKLAADPKIVALEDWPDVYYNWACTAALAGLRDKAISLLEKSAQADAFPPPKLAKNDEDLASLRGDPRFQQILTSEEQKRVLWQDNAALATPYRPVLSDAEKVAGLSKIWSEAKFNFAFFDRQHNLDWDKLYVETLPKVMSAPTTAAYYRVLIEFVAALHDAHSNVYVPQTLKPLFYAGPPLRTRLFADKVLVIGVYDPKLRQQGIVPGDEVVTIDGLAVRTYAQERVAPLISSSTAQDRDTRLYGYELLSGDKSKPVHLGLLRADGTKFDVTVERNGDEFKTGVPAASFKMLPNNIAYLAVNTMENDIGVKTMREHFGEIQRAKGLVIDVRDNGGGNSGNGYEILRLIADGPFRLSQARTRDYIAMERARGLLPGWKTYPAATANPADLHYSGPVAVLISGRTFSAAEDFAVAFDGLERGKLIGQTTAGSTGQPFVFKLPGGGMARICTKDDAYADGRKFEGIGIAPQIPITPTVVDVRAGRDPVLERALLYLETGK